ncbi:WD repeat-containing protein 46 isoform X1 [Hemitrygon akajei]|uniref:WD repeat-containing protein 46 isoform X1 n=1 Tax=Hemitrygon akajei TaxID=2704970 RepID=UPI003BF9D53C
METRLNKLYCSCSPRGAGRDKMAVRETARSGGNVQRKRYWEAEGDAGTQVSPAKRVRGKAAANNKPHKPWRRPTHGPSAMSETQVSPAKRVQGKAAANNKPHKPWRRPTHGPSAMSGRKDPFPGPAPLPDEALEKYKRGKDVQMGELAAGRAKGDLQSLHKKSKYAQRLAARFDQLLPAEAGFLEADEGEDTCLIRQEDIAGAVDIASSSKHFNLDLTQFGPYRINYTRNGRHLVLAGRRGHVAAMDWHSKRLLCEINVMERVNDIRWLHTETMYAVAQKKWLYIYDNQGVELHCVKKFNDVLKMEFLPYHFLLATCSARGFLQYLDISVGKEVAATCTKAGRLDVMAQNPHNAIIHLGHPQGTVTLWSPSVKEPLVKVLCHRGAVRAIAVDKTGTYMATSGLDQKLNIFDLRTYQPLHSYLLPTGASHLTFSQRSLLGLACGNTVHVYKDIQNVAVRSPYLSHPVRQAVHGLQFCPYEDVLGVGHGLGFTSVLVPGAGEANFDGLECNPYQSKKQRQEWEVKALLEKIQPELITLDPTKLGQVDAVSMEQKHQDRVERLGFDPMEKVKFEPRRRAKGRSSSGHVERRKKLVAQSQQREVIRESVEQKQKAQRDRQASTRRESRPTTALDRFRK